jgi:hypothetical protein
VGFLRRIRGARGHPSEPTATETADDASEATSSRSARPPSAPSATDIEADERALSLDLARSENERLDDLAKRQLRYAAYSWTPPAQGGERRAENPDAEDNGDKR